jgi:hypothetical protein
VGNLREKETPGLDLYPRLKGYLNAGVTATVRPGKLISTSARTYPRRSRKGAQR